MNKVSFIAILLVAGVATTINSSTVVAQVAPSPSKTVVIQSMMEQTIMRRNDLKTRVEKLQQQLVGLTARRSKSLDMQDRIGVSSESFGPIMKNLQLQRIQLMIDLAGLQARREALEKVQLRMEKEKVSAVMAPLKEMLKLEQESLQRVMKLNARGAVDAAQVADAKRQVLNVEVQMLEAEMSVFHSGEMGSELLDASLQRAEKAARLEKIETLLKTFTQSRGELEQADAAQVRIVDREQQLSAAKQNLSKAEDQLRLLQTEYDQLKQDKN